MSAIRERYSFGNLEEVAELPNLIAIQQDSFDYLMRHGLAEAFRASSPIVHHSGKYSLELEFDYEDEDLRLPPKHSVEECIEKDLTYAISIFVNARFINQLTGEIKQQTVFIGEFPEMTDRGTFIINGTERVVVSQLIRSPGVIFQAGERFRLRNINKHQLVKGTIHPFRGEWLDFDVEQRPGKEVTAGARVARKRRLSMFTLLTAFGYGQDNAPGFFDEFVKQFPFLQEQWDKEKQAEMTSEQALLEVFKRARPSEPQTLEMARNYLYGSFIRPETRRYDLSRVGRYKLNRKLGPEIVNLKEWQDGIYDRILSRSESARAWERERKLIRKRLREERAAGRSLTEKEIDQIVEEELTKNWLYGGFKQGEDRPASPHRLPDVSMRRPPEAWGGLAASEVLAACTYLLNLADGVQGYRLDDQDHFANRRIRTVGELIQNQVRIGLSRMERVVRERMSTQDAEAISPESLINTRPVAASVKEFFATSQLSQFMDQVNPLAGLTHRRRLSALGPGGLTRERAGFEVRDIHFSHYGRMCPIETPEGPNIALIGALSTYGKVNEFGFIETPYRVVKDGKVVPGEIRYLAADEEEDYVIAQANAPLNPDGTFRNDRVLVRQSPQAASLDDLQMQLEQESFFGATTQISFLPPDEVQLMDVSPKQIVSVATALIPFLEHDDANRALMGANMQRQAVPLLVTESPFIGTGLERRAALDAADVITADLSGRVAEVDGQSITVKYNARKEPTVYPLHKFQRSNQNTCVNQKPRVSKGDQVKQGQLIADGTSTDNGELALGKNLLVAFMSWEGYNFEDAIIVSERLVRDDVLTSVHIHEHEVEARDTKIGPEEISRDIPNVPDDILHNLDDQGIVLMGAEVRPGDVLVGKVSPKAETDLTPEERLIRAIFGEKAKEVRDTSLKLPHGEEGKVIDIKVLMSGEDHELQPGVNQLVRVHVAERRKISVGDKLAGRHGNKGVIASVLPVEDMPFLEDGTPVDVILNPLGVPSRMNVGQLLETHLGYAARWGWKGAEKHLAKEHIDKNPATGLERKTRPATRPAVLVETPVFDGARWGEEDEDSGKHLSIKQALENLNPDSADGSGRRLIGTDGKAKLYNGRTGQPFDQDITVGYMYILKLAHLVDDKIHARSTGPYSMITQQPLGGKAQFGGQRFGEMEVWALEAYGAAYCLQELLTTKSDDVVGRVKIYEAIIRGENIPAPGVPESFKVLIKEMQALCLNVKLLSHGGEQIKIQELDEEEYRTIESLGINLSRPERGSDMDDKQREAPAPAYEYEPVGTV